MSERNKDEKQKELDCQEQQNAQIRETGEAVLVRIDWITGLNF